LEELIADMSGLGFDEHEVRERVSELILYKMLAFDGEDTEKPLDTDLLKITPSGYIHLRALPNFVEYLSSAALHCPFVDHNIARRIGDIWNVASKVRDIAPSQKHEAARLLAEYLIREKGRLDASNPLFRERTREAESLLRAVTNTVNESSTQPSVKRARAAARKRRSQQRGAGSTR
jgi:hypothetical protein